MWTVGGMRAGTRVSVCCICTDTQWCAWQCALTRAPCWPVQQRPAVTWFQKLLLYSFMAASLPDTSGNPPRPCTGALTLTAPHTALLRWTRHLRAHTTQPLGLRPQSWAQALRLPRRLQGQEGACEVPPLVGCSHSSLARRWGANDPRYLSSRWPLCASAPGHSEVPAPVGAELRPVPMPLPVCTLLCSFLHKQAEINSPGAERRLERLREGGEFGPDLAQRSPQQPAPEMCLVPACCPPSAAGTAPAPA